MVHPNCIQVFLLVVLFPGIISPYHLSDLKCGFLVSGVIKNFLLLLCFFYVFQSLFVYIFGPLQHRLHIFIFTMGWTPKIEHNDIKLINNNIRYNICLVKSDVVNIKID